MYFPGIGPQVIHKPVDGHPLRSPAAGTLSAMATGDDFTSTARDDVDRLLDDDRLTAMGLYMETHAGLEDILGAELVDLGLSLSSFEVMIRLARSADHRLRMSELASQSTLTNSGLTRLVDRLESAGLITREPCETDRRGFYAVLTDLGLERLSAVLPTHLSSIDRVLFDVLDADEREALLRALRKMRAVVRPGSDPEVAAQA